MNVVEKLAVTGNSGISDAIAIKICQESVLKFGKTSEAFLMRKLKCSFSRAKEIIKEATSDNGCSVV